jgi:hypothetical protein
LLLATLVASSAAAPTLRAALRRPRQRSNRSVSRRSRRSSLVDYSHPEALEATRHRNGGAPPPGAVSSPEPAPAAPTFAEAAAGTALPVWFHGDMALWFSPPPRYLLYCSFLL